MNLFKAIALWRDVRRLEKKMQETKKPWESITIWGAAMNVVGLGLEITGVVSITPEEKQTMTGMLVTLATVGGQFIGMIMIVYGRIRAKKKIA